MLPISCCPVCPALSRSLSCETGETSFRNPSSLRFQANAPDGKSPHLVSGRESRGRVVTQGECEEVARIYRIVDTAVERHEVAFLPVVRIAGVFPFLLVRDVEVGDCPVRAVEVLPGVAGHHIEMMHAPLLVEVCVELEHLVAAELGSLGILADSPVLGVGECLERPRVHSAVGIVLRHVETEAEIEFQCFESVHLVVYLCVADHSHRASVIVHVVELGERSHAEQCVRGEVLAASRTVVPESVGGGVVDGPVLIPEVWVLGRVEEGRVPPQPRRRRISGWCRRPFRSGLR